MSVDALARIALPWALTWFVHATVLLVLVWGVTRFARLAPRTRVVLWRVGVIGPLVTATLPFVFELPTAGARIALPAPPPVAAVPEILDSTPMPLPPTPYVPTEPRADTPAPIVSSAPITTTTVATAPSSEGLPPATWLFMGWALAASAFVLRGLGSSLWIRRRLARRRPLAEPVLHATLGRLATRAGLRRAPPLTVSEHLTSPIAWGVWKPEICVPRRALDALAPAQQEAMLAHELAHVVRRDALWLAIERWVLRLLFVQPLLFVARREIREQTELACDELAVAITRAPMALAECLTEVAGWIVPSARPTAAPAMATTPSLLARRVEHLLEQGETPA
ncbi:MAG: M56 family metallopeptidase, partial [Planctomycetota bacterium]|nr:M56 family metallopeptidase [Planctomycetota bacterium]